MMLGTPGIGSAQNAYWVDPLIGGGTANTGVGSGVALNQPYGLARAPDGAIYISTFRQILRYDVQSGIVTVVAGKNLAADVAYESIGDGGPATEAVFRGSTGIDFDRAGNLYIADIGHGRVRRIDRQTGVISTVAGSGFGGAGFDGGAAPEPALDLSRPLATTNQGLILIGVSLGLNGGVIALDPSTGLTSMFMGGGRLQSSEAPIAPRDLAMCSPDGIAVAPNGDVAVSHCGEIVLLSNASGTVRRIYRDTFFQPRSLKFTPSGTLLASASNAGPANARILRINTANEEAAVLAGLGNALDTRTDARQPAQQAHLPAFLRDLIEDGERILFVDERSQRVRVLVPGDSARVTLMVNDATLGTIQSVGELFRCGASASTGQRCALDVLRGSALTFNASTNGPVSFGGWWGSCSGTAPTCALTINADSTIGANFSPVGRAPALTFAPIADRVFSDAPVSLSVTINSNQFVTAVTSGTACFFDGAVVRLRMAGVCEVTVVAFGDGVWREAAVTRSFRVLQAVAPTTRVIVSAPASATIGGVLRLAISVEGRAPTGSARVSVAPPVVGASERVLCPATPLVTQAFTGYQSAVAECVVGIDQSFPVGSASLKIVYSGDGNNPTSETTHVVNLFAGSPGTLGLSISSSRVTIGESVTVSMLGKVSSAINFSSLRVRVDASGSNAAAFSGCASLVPTALSGADGSFFATCTVPLPNAGTTTLSASFVGSNFSQGNTTPIVLTTDATGPRNYADLWWAGTSENGWGLSISQIGPTQFNVLYVYDESGAPIWYVMPGGRWNSSFTRYEGDVYEPRGAPHWNYAAASLQVGTSVGSIALDFTSPGAAEMTYTIRGKTGTKRISRQVFAPSPRLLAPEVGGLWWGGQAQNGWGLFLGQQQGQVFGVLYTYDTSNRPRWYVVPGGKWGVDPSGTSITFGGAMYSTRSSAWLGVAYRPAELQVARSGTMLVSIGTASTTATLRYMMQGPEIVHSILKQAF